LAKAGGNPNVIISIPEIKSFRITREHDFIVLASDGIYDKLSNKDVVQCVWNSTKDDLKPNIHKQSSLGVEAILKNALLRRTLDNVTVVLIAFSNFKHAVYGSEKAETSAVIRRKENIPPPMSTSNAELARRQQQKAVEESAKGGMPKTTTGKQQAQ